MGVQDRDWYIDDLREREKERQISKKTGLFSMLFVWCIVMGLVYGLMTIYVKHHKITILSGGDLIVHRSNDGHYYCNGAINGVDAEFIVDTGASLVMVSEDFAKKALIKGGSPATFQTANGNIYGSKVNNVNISVGTVSIDNVKVGVGLRGLNSNYALLGQSFLSQFDILITKNKLYLKIKQD